jgi:hypothetical protein
MSGSVRIPIFRTSLISLLAMILLGDPSRLQAGDLKNPAPPPETTSNKETMEEGWFTGPLVAPAADPNKPGQWVIEPYLLSNINYGTFGRNMNIARSPHNTYTLSSMWFIKYGLTDRLSWFMFPSFGYTLGHDSNSSSVHFGDFKTGLQYTFYQFQPDSWIPTISFALSEIFPTGQYDDLGTHPHDAFGLGSFQTEFGPRFQHYLWLPNGRILQTRLSLAMDVPTGTDGVSNASVFGTKNGFRGHANLGNQYKADLSFEYSLTSHWVPVIEFVYIHSDKTDVAGMQQRSSGLASIPVRSSLQSKDYFEIDPAIEYNFSKSVGIIAGAQIATIGRNTGASVIPQIAVHIFY